MLATTDSYDVDYDVELLCTLWVNGLHGGHHSSSSRERDRDRHSNMSTSANSNSNDIGGSTDASSSGSGGSAGSSSGSSSGDVVRPVQLTQGPPGSGETYTHALRQSELYLFYTR